MLFQTEEMSDKENASKVGGKKGRNHKPFGEMGHNGSLNNRLDFSE